MELQAKKVVIGNLEFYLGYSHRALFKYMNLTSKDPDNPELVIHYYYDLAKKGAELEGKEFNYTFEQFYDALDPYPKAFTIISEAIEELLGKDEGKKK